MPKRIRTWLSGLLVIGTFGLGVAPCGDIVIIGNTGDPSSCPANTTC